MTDDLNILKLVKDSDTGPIDIDKRMFVYIPDRAYETDEHGNKIKTDYRCSIIISLVKYNERKIHVSFLDLPHSYKGEKINFIDNDEYPWHYKSMNPIKLASYRGSLNWKDFK